MNPASQTNASLSPVSGSTELVVPAARPAVRGKFLAVGDEKLYVRGVTYGPFRQDSDGSRYHDEELVERDFAQMAASGINAIRTYTVPPRWLLDLAARHGLWVLVGLPWEQHVAFLDERARAGRIEARVRAGVRDCAGHPALLGYAVGNEIPAPIVRWHGRRKIERFIERLYRAAKQEDPGALVTYVNYPTTEYLQLPFLDFVCANVYLESQARFESYLARLQNIAGDRPLLMGEIGLDSRRHGESAQARSLDWQIRTAFASACAGVFVFAWTDEWHRGGCEIEDWDFGLTTRARLPKPALGAVRDAFAEVPFPPDLPWPKISVVVCSYNGGRTIRDCCEGLSRLDYPDYEVIVVSDGSTDATPAIAREHGFRVIHTDNRGLSCARNTGLEAAAGAIVAYTDDDARPDPQWLRYLAASFLGTGCAGIGGPNIAPAGDGPIADCVANSPGGPVHVLVSDREAEHIPGCNMAFWKSALARVGGFDPRYRTAGDDVDICWRLQHAGYALGFSPGAMVWHHRRNSVRMYWRQQRGYGRAEALLERKWPEKYNAVGHLTWAGRIYGKGLTQPLGSARRRIYHGTWGLAPFQSLYEPSAEGWASLPLMPEWYLIVLVLGALSLLGVSWPPLLWALPLFLLACAATLAQAALGAARAVFTSQPRARGERLTLRLVTTALHLMQPLARLWGRVAYGLTPWRRRGAIGLAMPRPRVVSLWHERWQAAHERLQTLEMAILLQGAVVLKGGDYDGWDLEVRGGMLAAVRVLMTIEEHGGGTQLARFAIWPRASWPGLWAVAFFALLTALAMHGHAWVAGGALAATALTLVGRMVHEAAAMSATVSRALRHLSISEA